MWCILGVRIMHSKTRAWCPCVFLLLRAKKITFNGSSASNEKMQQWRKNPNHQLKELNDKLVNTTIRAKKWFQQAKNQKQRLSRVIQKNLHLTGEIKKLKNKFRKAEVNSMEDVINKSEHLPVNFKTALVQAVRHQVSAGKTGRRLAKRWFLLLYTLSNVYVYFYRYTGDWILQALLLNILSPKAYRHLRSEGILPLPNPDYLRHLLRGLRCQFGFTDFVFQHLRKEFENKPRRDRQIFLVFDEMKVKEAITYDKIKMQFTGFIDYAEFSEHYKPRKAKKSPEANHALVFMIRTLNSKLVS